jgi:hypothetical protein
MGMLDRIDGTLSGLTRYRVNPVEMHFEFGVSLECGDLSPLW